MRRKLLPLLAAAAVILSACGDEAGPIDPSLDPIAVLRVEVSPTVDTIFAADTIRLTDQLQLSAVIIGRVGPITTANPIWISEDTTVATVSENGVVRPLRYGTVRIAASAARKGYATIVVAPAVTRVAVTPGIDTILVRDPIVAGDTRRLTARALDAAGRTVNGTRFEWTSSNPSVAVVDSTGLVRAIGIGSTTISSSAPSASVKGASPIIVSSVLKAISLVTPVQQALALDTIQLTAAAFDYSDSRVSDVSFVWRSSNTAVALVNDSGRVTSVAPGSATISASSSFRTASVTLTFFERRLLNVQAGGDFSCGTTALGRLYCWGDGFGGKLATDPDSSCFGEDEVRACTLAPKRNIGDSTDFRSVSLGDDFGCALALDRRILCWGVNSEGQLGNGGTRSGSLPSLATVSSVRFDSLTAGDHHACALTSTGSAYCWGRDNSGQLGDRRIVNSSTPIPVYGDHAFRAISAGGNHTCGILTNGTAMCWGDNSRGQLGNGTAGGFVDLPASVVLGGQYASISAGNQHTCAVTIEGVGYCWGDNSRGQLGTVNSAAFISTPAVVSGGLKLLQISAGGAHTCALSLGGAPYCWGDNRWRQSGLNEITGDRVLTPNPIMFGASGAFRTISVGARHACAYGVDGEAWCWGSNVFGALGNELQAAGRSTPQRVVRPR